MDPEGSIKLLSAILAGMQPLPGARCVGRYELFDEVCGEVIEATHGNSSRSD